MPSISSRPSASTMRQPSVRATGSGGLAVFICAYGSQTCAMPAAYHAGLLASFCPDIQRFHSRFNAAILAREQPCKIDMRSLDEFAIAKLGEIERNGLHRTLVETTRLSGIWMERNG